MTTMARSDPRMTAWPCRIIISSVTPMVEGRPWTTMPRLSPTKITSAWASTIAAIGAV